VAELEADLLAYYHVQRGGWNPLGMIELFSHMGEGSSAAEMLGAFASSHPLPSDREAQIKAEMMKFPPREGFLRSSERFAAVQAELKQLPRRSGL
jgi:predicted Zn-dependent protease